VWLIFTDDSDEFATNIFFCPKKFMGTMGGVKSERKCRVDRNGQVGPMKELKDVAYDNAEMRHEGKIAEHGKIEEAKYGDSKNHSTEQ
jgi:hypothetical protein